ncbi:MAG: inorganic phosphate transporter [Bacteroidales bacterium]|nr:inorganic phosphate transporter [Bacteroidales bacterium]
MFGLDLSLTLLLIFCIFAALSFEFINGFHDTANAVATVIYTHSLKPRVAVIWSGIWNFIGVNVGGIAVAIGIINLLPLEALTDTSIYHSISMILALIFTAIIWNIGTWYLGIPCSSSHTLLGSIFGVGIAYMLLPGSHDIALNWGKVKDVGLSLLISPLIGFFMAMFLMFLLKRVIKNKVIFKEPPAKKAPPMWIRSVLVLTCTFVSFSHGSNDGQKGVGLLMIILIAIVPVRFAIDHTRDPQTLHQSITKMHGMLANVNNEELSATDRVEFATIKTLLDSLDNSLTGVTSFAEISKKSSLDARRDILLVSKKSETLLKKLTENPTASVNNSWVSNYRSELKEVRSFTEYAPIWVILAIAISLGLGTMVGWKRIVVTIGEKIGKSHLTYAQGASAELIAATTISVSSWFGLPVSTTHVLSSGVAGTMVAENGTRNLQKKTVAAIGIAWLVTLPVTILFSGVLFLVFRMIFA